MINLKKKNIKFISVQNLEQMEFHQGESVQQQRGKG